MSYLASGLVCIANLIGAVSGAPKAQYTFTTNDTKATVEGAGYFNNAADIFNVGDVIQVSGDLDGTPFLSGYVVSSNDGSTVAITEHAAITQNVNNVLNIDAVALDGTATYYVVAPFDGTVDKIYSAISGALTTGDATITGKINGSAITNGAITVTQSGSAAGDVDVATPSAANTFSAGDTLEVTIGGTNDATETGRITFLVSPT